MKAVVLTRYAAPEDLEIADVPVPEPGRGEVRVRVHASSINDWDWSLCRGKPGYIRLFCGLWKPRVRVPGVDVAGVVDAVGRGVERWRVGDRVFGDLSGCGFGGFAEQVCAPLDAVVAAPESLSFEDAAALPHAAALAWQGLHDLAELRAGERLLVNGAGGGMGTLAVQMARALGVTDVTGVDHGDKHEAMRACGYGRVLDYRDVDFTREGESYDVVLDAKTTRGSLAVKRALRPGGRYATVGGETSKLWNVVLIGRLVGREGRRMRLLALKPNGGLDRVRELCDAGKLRPMIDRVVPLDEVPRSIRRFGRGEHTGKIVVSTGAG